MILKDCEKIRKCALFSWQRNVGESEASNKHRPYQRNIAQVLIADCEAFSRNVWCLRPLSKNHRPSGFWRDDAQRSNL